MRRAPHHAPLPFAVTAPFLAAERTANGFSSTTLFSWEGTTPTSWAYLMAYVCLNLVRAERRNNKDKPPSIAPRTVKTSA